MPFDRKYILYIIQPWKNIAYALYPQEMYNRGILVSNIKKYYEKQQFAKKMDRAVAVA